MDIDVGSYYIRNNLSARLARTYRWILTEINCLITAFVHIEVGFRLESAFGDV